MHEEEASEDDAVGIKLRVDSTEVFRFAYLW